MVKFNIRDVKFDLRIILILLGLGLVIMISQQPELSIITFEEPEWVEENRMFVAQEGISEEYLTETVYYDFSTPLIQDRMIQLMAISQSPREYIRHAAEFVFIKIDYNIAADNVQCINGIASKNLIAGEGDCTEQGMALIALLRGVGIPARAVGGCLYRDQSARCDLFAAVPFKQPKYKELTPEDIIAGDLSRRQSGERQGGLHLYLEVLVPTDQIKDSLVLDDTKTTENGAWIIVEPTTGELVKADTCFLYDEELVVPNDRKDLFCASDNITYAIFCSLL